MINICMRINPYNCCIALDMLMSVLIYLHMYLIDVFQILIIAIWICTVDVFNTQLYHHILCLACFCVCLDYFKYWHVFNCQWLHIATILVWIQVIQ
jgi:hypothetical protein